MEAAGDAVTSTGLPSSGPSSELGLLTCSPSPQSPPLPCSAVVTCRPPPTLWGMGPSRGWCGDTALGLNPSGVLYSTCVTSGRFFKLSVETWAVGSGLGRMPLLSPGLSGKVT